MDVFGPTTFYALFCTAQIPSATVNRLLELADANERTGIIWSLIRNHSQKRAYKPSDFPVEDLKTSFVGYSLEELGGFCCEKLGQDHCPADQKPISHCTFANTDERTSRDNTVVLLKNDSWCVQIDPNDASSEDHNLKDMTGWRGYRVEMLEITSTMVGLQFFDIGQGGPDEDGVYRFGKNKSNMS